jgi:hypothetical protein
MRGFLAPRVSCWDAGDWGRFGKSGGARGAIVEGRSEAVSELVGPEGHKSDLPGVARGEARIRNSGPEVLEGLEIDYTTLMVEILRDNARPEAGPVYGAMDMLMEYRRGRITQ